MRLIIEGFNQGLVDEDVITRMGLANIGEGLNSKEVRISNCPATDINAIDFSTRNCINKINGREELNSTPWKDSAIIRMYQWESSPLLGFSLAFSCVSGATSAAIATVTVSGGSTAFNTITISGTALTGWAPTIDEMIDITTYGGSAVMTYGSDLPLAVFTGSTYIAPILGTNAPSGAKTVAAWGSYLFAGNVLVDGIRQASRIVWCDPLQGSNWPAAHYMDLDPEDGDAITAMWVLKNVLVVFKRYKTYIVSYVGGVLQFDWERIDNAVGCVGPNAVCEEDGALYFIGPDGCYVFNGTSTPTTISDKIERMMSRVNAEKDYVCEADNYGEKGQIFFNIVEGSSVIKNKIYIYDPLIKNWSKWSISVASLSSITYGANQMFIDFPMAYETYSLRIGDAGGSKDSFMVFGTYDGKLQKYGESNNDLEAALNAYWVSPWIDFGYPDVNKRIIRVTVFADATGLTTYDTTFTVYQDWNEIIPVITETFNASGVDRAIAEKRIDFTLPCRACKFKININQLNATLIIHKIVVDFLVKGRTLV